MAHVTTAASFGLGKKVASNEEEEDELNNHGSSVAISLSSTSESSSSSSGCSSVDSTQASNEPSPRLSSSPSNSSCSSSGRGSIQHEQEQEHGSERGEERTRRNGSERAINLDKFKCTTNSGNSKLTANKKRINVSSSEVNKQQHEEGNNICKITNLKVNENSQCNTLIAKDYSSIMRISGEFLTKEDDNNDDSLELNSTLR